MYQQLFTDIEHEEELFNYFLTEYEENISGWDFSQIKNRMVSAPRSWSYESLVRSYLPKMKTILDMGTGGGEFLSRLPLPENVYATESYSPNLSIARNKLQPLGVKVVEVEDHDFLPLPDGKFDLIINRHEYYTPAEINRLLRDGGMFITQQVGAENNLKINELLNAPKPKTYDPYWTVNQLAVELQEVGLQILKQVSETYKPEFMI